MPLLPLPLTDCLSSAAYLLPIASFPLTYLLLIVHISLAYRLLISY